MARLLRYVVNEKAGLTIERERHASRARWMVNDGTYWGVLPMADILHTPAGCVGTRYLLREIVVMVGARHGCKRKGVVSSTD